MTKEKVLSLTKYLNDLTSKLNSPTPDKHRNRPQQYKELLEREIFKVKKTLNEAK